MKTMKKIAWMLCFVLIISSVVRNNYLQAEAQGVGTTFTVNVIDESGVEGNSVSYRFSSDDAWTPVSSGNAIDIAEKSSIMIKATVKEGARAEATSGGGFTESDFGGITGENGQTFELTDTVSYILDVKFVNNNGGGTPNPPQSNAGLKLDITNRDSATGTVTYTFLNADSQSLGTDTLSESTTNSIAFPEGTEKVNIKVTPGESSQLGMYGLYVNGTQMATDTDKANAVGTSGHTFNVDDATKEHQVQLEFTAASGGGNTNPIEDPITITINITSGMDYLDTYGNYLQVDGVAVENGSVTVEKAETHVIRILPQLGNAISASINGTVVTGTADDGWMSYTVGEAESYNIAISLAGNTVYTVVWDYVGDFGSDAIVSNGTVKIISATLPGGGNGIGTINSQNEEGGHVVIEPGSTVKVEIKPNYGYQFLEGSLNGNTITAGTEVGYFTFTMPSQNLHLAALFTASEDKKVIEAAGVSDAKMENCEGIIDSGNLELTVKDAALDDAQKSTLKGSDAGKGVSVEQWLEVDLNQIVNKGDTTSDPWRINQAELPHKIKVTLNVGTNLDPNKEYVVVREHEGKYERIPATYNQTAGTLTFESDKFSNYAVGTVVTASDVLGTINSTWDEAEGGSSASDTVDTLKAAYGASDVASAVQDSNGTVSTELLNKLQALESDYQNEKSIRVEDAVIAPAVSGSVSGPVTVTGAAFNADANHSVQLVIEDKAGSGITVGNSYSKSVQLDIKLQQTAGGVPTTITITDLSMPVTITMPIPTGINASRMVILHDIDGDGTSDETVPYSLSGSNVTLTLTHFSNFAFAEKASSTGGNGGGSGNAGGSGSGSGSGNTGGSGSGNTAGSGSSASNSGSSSANKTIKEEKVSVPVEYIVVRGDVLGRIARKYNMTLSALLALNPQIKNPNLIYPGQRIIVGYTGKSVNSNTTTSETDSDAEYYIVQRGDCLYVIARKHGLSLNRLYALNPRIAYQKYIYAGQKVRVR